MNIYEGGGYGRGLLAPSFLFDFPDGVWVTNLSLAVSEVPSSRSKLLRIESRRTAGAVASRRQRNRSKRHGPVVGCCAPPPYSKVHSYTAPSHGTQRQPDTGIRAAQKSKGELDILTVIKI